MTNETAVVSPSKSKIVFRKIATILQTDTSKKIISGIVVAVAVGTVAKPLIDGINTAMGRPVDLTNRELLEQLMNPVEPTPSE